MIDASRELNNKRAKLSRELGSTTAAKSWEALKTSHRVHEIIPPFDLLKMNFLTDVRMYYEKLWKRMKQQVLKRVTMN